MSSGVSEGGELPHTKGVLEETDESLITAKKTSAKQRRCFAFRHFDVDDDGCAMRVGTDGVLLGLFAGYMCTELRRVLRDGGFSGFDGQSGIMPLRILDIGCGSGVVSLVLMQALGEALTTSAASAEAETMSPSSSYAHRGTVSCTLIDIDPSACEASKRNIDSFLHRNALWATWFGHVEVLCMDITSPEGTAWVAQNRNGFHVIVSNPPYFDESGLLAAEVVTAKRAKKLARRQRDEPEYGESSMMARNQRDDDASRTEDFVPEDISSGRKKARMQSSLRPADVHHLVRSLLSPVGFAALVYPHRDGILSEFSASLPHPDAENGCDSHDNGSLRLSRCVAVSHAPAKPAIRTLLLLTFSSDAHGEIGDDNLVLHDQAGDRSYSEQYAAFAWHVYPWLPKGV